MKRNDYACTDRAGMRLLFENFLQNRTDGYENDSLATLLFENYMEKAIY